jgi:hypothetical protein
LAAVNDSSGSFVLLETAKMAGGHGEYGVEQRRVTTGTLGDDELVAPLRVN